RKFISLNKSGESGARLFIALHAGGMDGRQSNALISVVQSNANGGASGRGLDAAQRPDGISPGLHGMLVGKLERGRPVRHRGGAMLAQVMERLVLHRRPRIV